jgi:exonuclease SbcC
MDPLRLRLRNYRSFRALELELPAGCIAVLGENGAGKSSIVNALELALFGDRHFGDQLNEEAEGMQLMVELEFEHGSELYRVRRGKKGAGAVKVDFERGPDWEPLTRETAAATQELIEETIGLARETFRASAFLAQGDGAAFTEAQPRERKAILAEVLGLEVWDRLLERAKTDRASLERTGHRLVEELARSEAELVRQPDLEEARSELQQQAQQAQKQVIKGMAQQAQLQHELTEARAQQARADEIRSQLEGGRRAELTLANRIKEIEADFPVLPAPAERLQVKSRSDRIPALEAELNEAAAYAEEYGRYREKLLERNGLFGEASAQNERAAILREEAKRLQAAGPGSEHCASCGQLLGAEALERSLEVLNRQAVELDAAAAALDEQAATIKLPAFEVKELREPALIQAELGEARQAATVFAQLDERARERRGLEEQRARYLVELTGLQTGNVKLQRRLSELELPDIAALESNLELATARIDSSRGLLDTVREQLAVTVSELKRLAGIAEQLELHTTELEETQAQLDVVTICERAYGRDGIPTMIVENAAIPQIELEANRILNELGTSFTVELRTQRELKTGGVAESLDIVVLGPAGGARAYETFSGGERTRLNLALRIALARLLAHRRGAEVRVLVVDEPEFLDEPGVARLAEVLRGLSADFERVILISHQPALREAFDEVLVVEKHDGISTIAGVPEAEEVLA